MSELENKVSPVGTHSYDFEFRVPEWLPDSTIYRTGFAGSIFTIRYSVFAQLLPVEKKDYFDVNKNISNFRANKEIYLFKKQLVIPQVQELKAVIQTKVGGVFGLGGSQSITNVVFDKQQYYPGEKVEVKLDCDNSKCSSAVKSFKIKLKRKIFARGSRTSTSDESDIELLKTSKYLYQYKDTRVYCGPKQKVKQTLSFTIPKLDPDFTNDTFKCQNEDQMSLMKAMTGSFNGELFQVQYSIKIFVKHAGLITLGEGACVTLPIRIFPERVGTY